MTTWLSKFKPWFLFTYMHWISSNLCISRVQAFSFNNSHLLALEPRKQIPRLFRDRNMRHSQRYMWRPHGSLIESINWLFDAVVEGRMDVSMTCRSLALGIGLSSRWHSASMAAAYFDASVLVEVVLNGPPFLWRSEASRAIYSKILSGPICSISLTMKAEMSFNFPFVLNSAISMDFGNCARPSPWSRSRTASQVVRHNVLTLSSN